MVSTKNSTSNNCDRELPSSRTNFPIGFLGSSAIDVTLRKMNIQFDINNVNKCSAVIFVNTLVLRTPTTGEMHRLV